jgi:hypothetical protein
MLRCFLRDRFLVASAWLRDVADVGVFDTRVRFAGADAMGVAVSVGRSTPWVSIGMDLRLLTIARRTLVPSKQKAARDLCRAAFFGTVPLLAEFRRRTDNVRAGRRVPRP